MNSLLLYLLPGELTLSTQLSVLILPDRILEFEGSQALFSDVEVLGQKFCSCSESFAMTVLFKWCFMYIDYGTFGFLPRKGTILSEKVFELLYMYL